MDGMISFAAAAASGANLEGRNLVAAAAMRRYVPHIVAWRCPQPGEPISVTLPENLSASELVRRAEGERVLLAAAEDDAAPDRVFQLYYAHLAEVEIEEGIRRLGLCLARYTELAARHTPGHPGTLVGT